MKVVILSFSPGGNTMKVAHMLQEKLISEGAGVQIVDATRRGIYTDGNAIRDFLEKNIGEHDVLLVGGPVYAHHLHHNVLSLIDALPKPRCGWGRIAAPFVTYGSISSGVALHEAGKRLRSTGRTVAMGMKIEAFHCMSRLLAVKINEGKPGNEAQPLIDDLAGRIAALDLTGGSIPDITGALNYQALHNSIKANVVFREKLWQKHIYPKLKIDAGKCAGCGACARACPVQRLEANAQHIITEMTDPGCVHCGECIHACRRGALAFAADLEKWNGLFKKAADGRGPMASNENPKSMVYPAKT